MYKITIDISNWGLEDETLTVETHDFDKVQIIQEFIEMQKEYGWAVDYVATQELDTDEDEEYGSEYVYDEDYDVWCMYDDEEGAWYWYDETDDFWVLCEDQDEAETDDEADDEADDKVTVTAYVITKVED